ncbi:hypothetical protein [Sporosarcina limicola]|uniref:Uncharacterized protein n=1 Tax=Sporosarcina limicola TaxID=34101 RepID=A0A927MJ80_9BACL|nr:hypothetical protein [Sporosarcina limicola]MBE1555680.1 hypothetical protein [Sporosarcina limicola]
MTTFEKDINRMEVQIGQLIRIVANLNDRLNRFEDTERKKRMKAMHKMSNADRA